MAEAAVVVVGAGASFDYGLPVGAKLIHDIAEMCAIETNGHSIKGNRDWLDLMGICANMYIDNGINVFPYYEASKAIARGMPLSISIDNFLHTRQEDEIIVRTGKIAITKAILEAERRSTLYSGSSGAIDFLGIQDKWLSTFFKTITEYCSAQDLAERLKKFTFVIFNYDRCVEHFLYHAIQEYYGVDRIFAAKVLHEVKFLHPYGTVGDLPWQMGGYPVPFGEELEGRQIVEVAKGINTFTEGMRLGVTDVQKVRDAVDITPMMIFLGFAYYRQNIQILYPEKTGIHAKSIYGTALYMSDFNVESVAHELLSKHGSKAYIRNDLDCSGLLKEYSRAISFTPV